MREDRFRYHRSFLQWDRSASLSAARRMAELAPQLPWLRMDLGWRLLELNRPREALEALAPIIDAYDPLLEAAWYPLMEVTAAHHTLGDYRRELEYTQFGLERYRGVAFFFYAQARALAAMGQTGAVNEVIEKFLRVPTRGGSAGGLMSATAMELRAHGQREVAEELAARSVKWYDTHPPALLADEGSFLVESLMVGYPEERGPFVNALWAVGRWHELEDVIVQLIEDDPGSPQVAGWLGVIAAVRGEHGKAMRISGDLLAGDSPRSVAWGNYWQASIAAHLGEKERAVELLAEAFSKGYPYGFVFHNSMEFEPLWDYPPFQELIEPEG